MTSFKRLAASYAAPQIQALEADNRRLRANERRLRKALRELLRELSLCGEPTGEAQDIIKDALRRQRPKGRGR